MKEEDIKILEEKVEKEFLKSQELLDNNLEQAEVDSLSEALAIDYVEKWKVYARMKLAESNLEKSENLRKSLTQKLVHVNANLEVTLKALEDKKIAVAFEINEKEKLKEEMKVLKAELRSLKKPKEVSKRSAPEKKSVAKNA